MAYFEDLSDYCYFERSNLPRSLNVGWLQNGRPFETATPSERIIEALWNLCKVAVMQARGLRDCDLCGPEHRDFFAERNGEGIWLGSAEIRVFSTSGKIYAAPNLIYHYVRTHHYQPPQEFLLALGEGPLPPGDGYFDRLRTTGLEWSKTSKPPRQPQDRKDSDDRRKAADGLDSIACAPG